MTEAVSRNDFLNELKQRQQRVDAYLAAPRFRDWFGPDRLANAIFAYVKRSGKRLRPGVLLFACGAAGGEEEDALPAAAAVELFHTWTLVHDDLIDNDHLRRGSPTVHQHAADCARTVFGCSAAEARDYGRDVAVLAGDVQQAWSIALLLEVAATGRVDPALVVQLGRKLTAEVTPNLIRGEMLDVEYGFLPLASLSEREILEMLRLKTGVLYEFAGLAGACIGARRPPDNPGVAADIAAFTGLCGTAFQLQDDILGITGDEVALGKPVGSDLREGKRTTIVLHAFARASAAQRRFLNDVLGRPDVGAGELTAARDLLLELGGVEHTAVLARAYLDRALQHLEAVPESRYKALLRRWADFMVSRSF